MFRGLAVVITKSGAYTDDANQTKVNLPDGTLASLIQSGNLKVVNPVGDNWGFDINLTTGDWTYTDSFGMKFVQGPILDAGTTAKGTGNSVYLEEDDGNGVMTLEQVDNNMAKTGVIIAKDQDGNVEMTDAQGNTVTLSADGSVKTTGTVNNQADIVAYLNTLQSNNSTPSTVAVAQNGSSTAGTTAPVSGTDQTPVSTAEIPTTTPTANANTSNQDFNAQEAPSTNNGSEQTTVPTSETPLTDVGEQAIRAEAEVGNSATAPDTTSTIDTSSTTQQTEAPNSSTGTSVRGFNRSFCKRTKPGSTIFRC